MFWKLLVAFGLMASCVVIHAVGITAALRWLRRRATAVPQSWRWVWLFILLAAWVIACHMVEIAVWGAYYAWTRAMPDFASALYFSVVTYTTTGYGDLVLPEDWRLVGGVEALTGILMCGWSTGFFFSVVSGAWDSRRTSGER